MAHIFINYRRQDSEGYVGRLFDHLSGHFEPDALFMDVDSIPPGADFVTFLSESVAACDVFLSVIGPHWLTLTDDAGSRRIDQWNDFVHIEIQSALEQNKLIIPVLVGGAKMPSPKSLPEDIAALSNRNAVELSHQRFSYDVEKLVEAIKEMVPATPAFKLRSDSETVRAKAEALKKIREELMNATDSPIYSFRTRSRYFPVLGDGNPDANLLFIGEAPGKYEAAQGMPFVGPSGEILAEMLAGIGMKREDVYITNLLLDHPEHGEDPTLEEIAYYAPFVNRIIDIIEPAVIVTLGRFAMQHLLNKFDLPEKRGKISNLHGQLLKVSMPYGEIHLVPLYHPAVVLYSASQKELLRKDFQRLKMFV
jgi:uracil-DNA glycosylase